MNRFKFLVVTLLLSTTLSVFASQNSEATNQNSSDNIFFAYSDSNDRLVTVKSEPLRVISLAPSITETIYALNAQDKLVGRTNYCNYPSNVSNVESIGTLYQPNIEKIVELNPDVIIASTHFKDEVLKKLEEASMTIIVLNEDGSFDGVYKNISTIGKLLNRESESEAIITSIKDKVKKVTDAVSGKERPLAYYIVGYGEYGDYTAGGDTFISDIIEMAGAENAAIDSIGWSYSLEKIVEKNPSIFICSQYNSTKEGVMDATGYKDIPAVKNGNIFTIDNNLIDRQGPRVADGLEAMAKIFHPGSF